MSLTDDPLIGRQLGDYRVVDILGRGGMAHVYRGYDDKLQRYAAVKVIDANLLAKENDDEYRQRFQREARAIARLNHPNIVGVYQFGEVGPLYYMAMAFIEGHDLGHILKEHASNGTMMPPQQILQIIRDIAGALDYAHAGGVIHRDIKPSNIMVTADNRAILTDFGLALSVPEGSIGNTFGSAHYIAPEQAISSANAVAQSDLYSLGVVLYQMLTGKVPFDDPSAMSVAIKHLSDPPVSPRRLNPSLSLAVEKVVLKALEKEPSKRFQNGESLARSLEEALLGDKELTDEYLATITNSRSSPAFPMVTLTKDQASDSPTPPFRDSQLRLARERLESAKRRLNHPVTHRTRLIGGGLVVVILVLMFGIWAIARNNSGGQPAATPTVVAAASTQEATSTPNLTDTQPPNTPAPTLTSTTGVLAATKTTVALIVSATTDTPSPSSTPTATNTSTPSETQVVSDTSTSAPEITPSVEAASDTPIWLIYDDTKLVLTNRSTQTINIRGWEFVQEDSLGQITFYSTQWQSSILGSVQRGQCYMIWPNNLSDAGIPDYCNSREAWFAAGTRSRFWIGAGKSKTFSVLDDTGAVIAVCPVDAGECGVKVSTR